MEYRVYVKLANELMTGGWVDKHYYESKYSLMLTSKKDLATRFSLEEAQAIVYEIIQKNIKGITNFTIWDITIQGVL